MNIENEPVKQENQGPADYDQVKSIKIFRSFKLTLSKGKKRSPHD